MSRYEVTNSNSKTNIHEILIGLETKEQIEVSLENLQQTDKLQDTIKITDHKNGDIITGYNLGSQEDIEQLLKLLVD